ncbi:hypothetical protein IGI42_000612 [Enterococcus sp. AZ109]
MNARKDEDITEHPLCLQREKPNQNLCRYPHPPATIVLFQMQTRNIS